jgi:hypothetical protein
MADRKVAVTNKGQWARNTAYVVGDIVGNAGKVYKCTSDGTSVAELSDISRFYITAGLPGYGREDQGAIPTDDTTRFLITAGLATPDIPGPTGTGSAITDGGATWAYQDSVDAFYPSLNAALSGESADLVTNTCILTIDCYNFEDTTAADTGTGYTVSSSYYIKIQAHDSHGGKWSTSAYRLAVGNSHGLVIQEQNTRLIGIQTSSNASSDYRYSFNCASGIGIYAERCIATTGGGTGVNRYGFYIDSVATGYTATLINCLVYDLAGIGFYYSATDSLSGNFLNCTAVGCTVYGFTTSYQDSIAKNCLAYGCGTGFGGVNSDWGSASATNASDDTSVIPGTGDVDLSGYAGTDIFVDYTNKDFHLKSSSPCIGVGTDLSATFTTDIDGETRPTGAGTWDIGADEYVAAGGTFIYIPFKRFNYIARLCFAAISLIGGLLYALR